VAFDIIRSQLNLTTGRTCNINGMYLVPPKLAERQDMCAHNYSRPPQRIKLHRRQKKIERNILRVIYTEIDRIPPVAMVGRYWRDETAILGAQSHFATERTGVFILEELTTHHPCYDTACDNHTKVIKVCSHYARGDRRL